MTYLEFHLVFIVPLLLLELIILRYRRQKFWRPLLVILGLAVVAFFYTTPWDNYLVQNGVWWYGKDRVLGVIGYVPIEEYAFFILQTFLTGLFLYLVRRPFVHSQRSWPSARKIGLLLLTCVTIAGFIALLFDKSFYFGLIFAWATPIVMLQWAVGGPALLRRWPWVGSAIFIPTVYLGLADSYAIKQGIWSISPEYTFGIYLGNLPIEEALFFLMTNVMVVFGLELVWCLSEEAVTTGQSRWRRLQESATAKNSTAGGVVGNP